MRHALVTTRYEKVGFPSTKSGVCPVCGKPARRTKEFYQTISPFNRNADGAPKTGREIISELRVKVAEWKLEPTYHAKCE